MRSWHRLHGLPTAAVDTAIAVASTVRALLWGELELWAVSGGELWAVSWLDCAAGVLTMPR